MHKKTNAAPFLTRSATQFKLQPANDKPRLEPAQARTLFFIGEREPGGVIKRLTRYDLEQGIGMTRLAWARRRNPRALLVRRLILDSIIEV
jgi:hypothetical protein